MRPSVRLRPSLLAPLVALCALIAAGCGGSSSGESDLASVAPPGSPLFISATIRPQGEAKADVEALAQRIGGVEDLGGLIVFKIEESASEEGDSIDFAKEVEPWLGEEAAYFAEAYEEGNFRRYGVVFQTSDEEASWNFVKKVGEEEKEPAKTASYEGVEYEISSKGQAVGVFDGVVAVASSEAVFKDMVDASEGESLVEAENFSKAMEAAPADSLGTVFVDIGGLIRQSGSGIPPEAKDLFESAGIEPRESTALASVVPGPDHIEIDLSSNVIGENQPSGDPSKMLASLPGSSVGALATAGLGKALTEGIDKLDAKGIPGQVPPHELKNGLKQAGIDVESIASSLGDAGVFLTGNSRSSLGGAFVAETSDPTQAKNTVSNIGLLLRATGTPGVSAMNGKLSGFSVHSAELGPQPLVVAAGGKRIAIAYGVRAAAVALQESGQTLGENPAFGEASGALGSTPMSGFVDGQAALRLASALVPPGERGFQEAKRYLNKVRYVAIGSEASGELATAKLIVGIAK